MPCYGIISGSNFWLGSLMQQLTQKSLSPLTLGSSSGAWLALVVVNIWFSNEIKLYQTLAGDGGSITRIWFSNINCRYS